MKIKYLKQRHAVYWYIRRVPLALHHVLGNKHYQKSLYTKDLGEAIKRVEVHSALFDELLDKATPEQLYNAALERLKSPMRDPDVDFDPRVSDLLDSVPEHQKEAVFNSLTPADQANWLAAQEVVMGRDRPLEYTASLKSVMEQYLASRSDLPPKTLDKFRTAVDRFLGTKQDIPIVLIDRRSVLVWLTQISSDYKAATRSGYCLCLATIWNYAADWEMVNQDSRNPFEGHKFKSDTVSYTAMDDETLTAILSCLPEPQRLPAIIGRYSGMRVSEIFESTLTEESGILCFKVGKTATYKGAKTAAGNRLVPVRESVADQVLEHKPNWNPKGFDAYSKRFGRAKAKVVGSNRPDLTFHSLRSQFTTHAGQAGYSEQQVAWLVGHQEGKGKTMSGQLYFRGYKIDLMRDIVESIPAFNSLPE